MVITLTPGAITVGFILPSLNGPVPLNMATLSSQSVAPTVITFTPSPGDSTQPRQTDDATSIKRRSLSSRFPAATQTTAPESTALSDAIDMGGFVSPRLSPPRLMLKTSASLSRAHSMPAIMSEI